MKIEISTQNRSNLRRAPHYYFCDCCGKQIEDNAPYVIGFVKKEFCKQCAMDIVKKIQK